MTLNAARCLVKCILVLGIRDCDLHSLQFEDAVPAKIRVSLCQDRLIYAFLVLIYVDVQGSVDWVRGETVLLESWLLCILSVCCHTLCRECSNTKDIFTYLEIEANNMRGIVNPDLAIQLDGAREECRFQDSIELWAGQTETKFVD
jgi:hypothetical protein